VYGIGIDFGLTFVDTPLSLSLDPFCLASVAWLMRLIVVLLLVPGWGWWTGVVCERMRLLRRADVDGR